MPKVDRALVEDHGWPPILAEAVGNRSHNYSMRLSSGELITFSDAEACGPNCEWVRLVANSPSPGEIVGRSIEVRVRAIIWCVGLKPHV